MDGRTATQIHGDLMNGPMEARWGEQEDIYRDMNGPGKCMAVENGG